MSVQKSPARRETEKSSKVKKLRNEFKKKLKQLGKKLKLKEKFGKIFGKIGEKKVEKKVEKNSILVHKKLYVSKKSPTRREAEKS